MKYQIVLQWPASSEADFDRVISLEELIQDGLGDIGIVDGHDFGSGEMNVFIHTDNPEPAFEKIKTLLSVGENMREMKAGYRDFDGDDYIAIYPQDLKQFSVI
jgi:hypothetical protein